jgi:hypothetical protein
LVIMKKGGMNTHRDITSSLRTPTLSTRSRAG